MKRLIVKLAFGLMIVSLITESSAQEIQQKGNVDVYRSPTTRQIEKLVFKDSETGGERTFDVAANNPFSQVIPKGKRETTDTRTRYFKTSSQSIKSIIRSDAKFRNTEFEDENVVLIGHDTRLLQSESEAVHGLVNVLYLYNKDDVMIGARGNFQILDESGEIKKEIEVDTDIRSATLSENGNFLAFNYGGIVDHNDSRIFDEGLSLFDTQVGQEILNIESENGANVKPPFTRGHLMIFKIDEGRNVKYHVIDTNSKVLYSKAYNRDKLFKLKKITTTGFEFNGGLVDEYKQTFNTKDF